MKPLLVLLLVFGSSAALAHREHGAHVHGAAKLSLAFDDTNGKMDFETPAMSIVGFEHPAKTTKDKAAVSEALAKFNSDIQKLVQFDPTLNCKFQKDKLEVKADEDGDHSDFVGSFTVSCAKSPLGSTLTLDFTKYPQLKDVDAVVLVGDLQKTAEVKTKPLKIELKP